MRYEIETEGSGLIELLEGDDLSLEIDELLIQYPELIDLLQNNFEYGDITHCCLIIFDERDTPDSIFKALQEFRLLSLDTMLYIPEVNPQSFPLLQFRSHAKLRWYIIERMADRYEFDRSMFRYAYSVEQLKNWHLHDAYPNYLLYIEGMQRLEKIIQSSSHTRAILFRKSDPQKAIYLDDLEAFPIIYEKILAYEAQGAYNSLAHKRN